ncbi:hypothetical protein C8J56DRAFT_949915 [Mycena floridula]|nr:hypothetical protein C8J56DRAFT_949915 [Mycena floridula]
MPLKTLALIKESELGDGMMLQVPFSAPDSPEYKSANGPQVLLSRLGDTIHATSAYCTHYGAPLVKGILTADGKVTCPWHGACFRVESGDIEDFPAPSGIHSFKAWVEDGMVWVRADEGVCLKETSARPPKLSTMGFDAVGKGTVIVGGGAGALGCAESLRENGYKYPITILSSEPHAPIDRTKLSKSPGGDVAKLTLLTPATLKIKMGVNLRIGVAVTGIDVERRRVWVGKDTSRESIAYDKLVLATGGVPRVLPVQGVWKDPSTKELQPNVYTLRTHADSVKIEGAVGRTTAPAKHMVIVGSSFIGMELVAALSKRNLKISVIGMESVPFEAVLGKEVGRGLMEVRATGGSSLLVPLCSFPFVVRSCYSLPLICFSFLPHFFSYSLLFSFSSLIANALRSTT